MPVAALGASMVTWTLAMDLPGWLYHMSSVRCARNKSFFTTERGLYGIAVRTIRKGDKVALITGLRVPVILRPAQERDVRVRGICSRGHSYAWRCVGSWIDRCYCHPLSSAL